MHLRPTGRALLQLVGDAVKRGRHLAGALHRGHWGRRERPRRRLAFFTLTHEPTCSGAATRLASGKGYTFEGYVFTPSRQRLPYRRASYEARYIARACALGRARVVYCFQSFKRGASRPHLLERGARMVTLRATRHEDQIGSLITRQPDVRILPPVTRILQNLFCEKVQPQDPAVFTKKLLHFFAKKCTAGKVNCTV